MTLCTGFAHALACGCKLAVTAACSTWLVGLAVCRMCSWSDLPTFANNTTHARARAQEVEVLRQQVSNYDKSKLTLQLTKQRLAQADKQFKNLEWEKEVLSQRFTKVERERDDLYARFEASVYELQQKAGLKGVLLERKLEAAYEVLEKKESQLAEILVASNLDAPTLQNVRCSPCSVCKRHV
jgi:septal ring factor EnvC (AmiA/AmiB activator)